MLTCCTHCLLFAVHLWLRSGTLLRKKSLCPAMALKSSDKYQVVCLALMTEQVLREWNILPKGSLSSALMRASSDHICKAHGHVGKIQNYLDACSV